MPLGWLIIVYRQENGGSLPASAGAAPGTRLAVWQTGLGGLDWLNDLVRQGQAIAPGGNGYPIELTARAEQITPRLSGEPPESNPVWTFGQGDIISSGWLGKTTINSEAVDACRPDEWLLIQAWDES